MSIPCIKYVKYVFFLMMYVSMTSAWAYKGFDFTKRADLKSIRAQHIQVGMIARLPKRTLLRFYVGATSEDAKQWIVKMQEHYVIYQLILDGNLSTMHGYDIYVAQNRIYCTHRNNVGYCVDIHKGENVEPLHLFLQLGELLLEGDVNNSIIPSIISRASVDTEGNSMGKSHFTIDLPKGSQMLYRGGIIDQQATLVGRKNNLHYVGFQRLPSHIYIFDSYGYGRIFVYDDVLGFRPISDENGANLHVPLQKTEEKVFVPK